MLRTSEQKDRAAFQSLKSLLGCVGVGFVRRPQLLVGGVHSVTTNPRGSWRAVGAAGD